MGVFYETVPDSLRTWILAQKVFWVASAPLSGSGHVNVSPKGGPYFGLIDEKTFWYMDLTGSGSETIAHLHERGNGRITIMFNAFEGGPKIVRLWGLGRVLEHGTQPFERFIEEHNVETIPGTRSIIIVDVHQVGSSCGFSVPFYDFKEFRPTLNDHFAKLVSKHERTGEKKDGIDHYWAYKNAFSMDGMPSMQRAFTIGKSDKVRPIKKMVGPLAPTKYGSQQTIEMRHALLIALASFLIGILFAFYAPELKQLVSEGVKGSPLEIKTVNVSHIPALEGLTGLWTTK